MYVLKGFVTNARFANNAPGTAALFGELTAQSLTYARNRGTYTGSAVADISLVSFVSAIDGTAFPISSILGDHVISVAAAVYNSIATSSSSTTSLSVLTSLLSTFNTVASTFQCGAIVTDGTHYCPEWVSWTNLSITDIANNTIKLWFVDSSFQTQYDEYEIVVIPPVDALDNFFTPVSSVRTLLAAGTPSSAMSRIQTAKQGCPETVIRSDVFNYIDPYNAATAIPTTWSTLVYGNAGNNPDSIANALIAYVLSHSTHARSEWIALLPDLFRRTEFVILPIWNQYAIPNRTLQAGLYSPIVNLQAALTLIETAIPAYPLAHVAANTCVFSNPYKSLQLLAVGSPENRNSWFRITDVFKDYISVSSTSLDFNRQSQTTQDWSTLLDSMIIIAETLTISTSLPATMTKVTRDGVLYLVSRYANIDYLVAAKTNSSATPGA